MFVWSDKSRRVFITQLLCHPLHLRSVCCVIFRNCSVIVTPCCFSVAWMLFPWSAPHVSMPSFHKQATAYEFLFSFNLGRFTPVYISNVYSVFMDFSWRQRWKDSNALRHVWPYKHHSALRTSWPQKFLICYLSIKNTSVVHSSSNWDII